MHIVRGYILLNDDLIESKNRIKRKSKIITASLRSSYRIIQNKGNHMNFFIIIIAAAPFFNLCRSNAGSAFQGSIMVGNNFSLGDHTSIKMSLRKLRPCPSLFAHHIRQSTHARCGRCRSISILAFRGGCDPKNVSRKRKQRKPRFAGRGFYTILNHP